MTIYEQMKQAGVQIDHHESDLYVPVNTATSEILSRWRFKRNVTRFTSQIDGKSWYDIPFAYDPFWESKQRGEHGIENHPIN